MGISAKIAFFIVCLSALFLSGCVTDRDEPSLSIGEGDRVPAFTVTLSDGRVFDTAGATGKPGVIVFFSTGCGDCRRCLPQVQSAYEACGAEAEFVCISREEDEERVSAYWQAEAFTMPYSAQADRVIYSLFATSGVPRVYVYDTSMSIVAAFSDADEVSADMLIAAVARACD